MAGERDDIDVIGLIKYSIYFSGLGQEDFGQPDDSATFFRKLFWSNVSSSMISSSSTCSVRGILTKWESPSISFVKSVQLSQRIKNDISILISALLCKIKRIRARQRSDIYQHILCRVHKNISKYK